MARKDEKYHVNVQVVGDFVRLYGPGAKMLGLKSQKVRSGYHAEGKGVRISYRSVGDRRVLIREDLESRKRVQIEVEVHKSYVLRKGSAEELPRPQQQ